MARDFIQEQRRQKEADTVGQTIANLQSFLANGKELTSRLRTSKQRITDGVVTGEYDQADLDTLSAKAKDVSMAVLKEMLTLGDLAGGDVAITVGGVAVVAG